MNSLIPTPIVDRNGKLTTVYKKLKANLSGKPAIPAPTGIASTSSVSVSDASTVPTVFPANDGGFEVTAYDPHFKWLTHKFGDLTPDKETAERLNEADPQKKYQLGDCGTFAGELWNLSEHVSDYRIVKIDSEPVFGAHQFVRLEDGTCVDSQGLWTEEAFLRYWKDWDDTAEIATFDLDDEPDEKNPDFPVSNPELLNIVKDLIEQHVKDTTKK